MRHILYVLLISALIVGACAPQADAPVNSDTPSAPGFVDYAPRPSDSGLTRTEVYVDEVDLLTLESYPLQFTLSMKGSLPTPCDQLRVVVSPPDQDDRVDVQVYSVANPNIMCAEVLQPYEINVPLGSFPSGHYTILVNGRMIAEFDA